MCIDQLILEASVKPSGGGYFFNESSMESATSLFPYHKPSEYIKNIVPNKEPPENAAFHVRVAASFSAAPKWLSYRFAMTGCTFNAFVTRIAFKDSVATASAGPLAASLLPTSLHIGAVPLSIVLGSVAANVGSAEVAAAPIADGVVDGEAEDDVSDLGSPRVILDDDVSELTEARA